MTSYSPTVANVDYSSGWPQASWAAQRLDIYSITGDGYLGFTRPCVVIIPDDYAFSSNAGTRPASLDQVTTPFAWMMRNRGWNVVIASLSYANAAAGAGVGEWSATGSALPTTNLAEPDLLRVHTYLRANAATYLIDTTKILLVASGAAATAAIRATLHADGVFVGSSSATDLLSHQYRAVNLEDADVAWKALAGSLSTGGHVTGAGTISAISAGVNNNLSAGNWLLQDTGYRTDIRSTPIRMFHTIADLNPTGHASTLAGVLSSRGSEWNGQALDAAIAGTSAPASEGVPTGRSAVRTVGWASTLWTAYDRLATRAAALEADAKLAPVEDIIIDAVEDALRSITYLNGYETDVAHVTRADDVNEDGYPAWPVILTEEADTTTTSDFATISHNTIRLSLYAMMADEGETIGTNRLVSKMIADVRKALQSAFLTMGAYVGAFRGLPIVNSRIVSWERVVGSIAEQPSTGSRITIEIDYRDEEDDPYTGSTAL